MSIAEIIAYSLFTTAGITIGYLVLIAIETKKGIRYGKKFRRYADQKIIAIAKRLGKKVDAVNTLYERGADEVEKDLIDPVTKPIVETQQRYTTLKTGKREIIYTGKKGVSPHLQKIVEVHKKNNKKRRKKQNRKQRKQQKQEQEIKNESSMPTP